MSSSPSPSLSPRLAALRADVMQRKGSWPERFNPFIPDVALWRAAAPGLSRIQHRARYLVERVRLSPQLINPGWRLCGEHLWNGHGAPFAFGGEPDAATLKQLDEFGLSADEAAAVKRTVRLWNGTGEASPNGRDPQYVSIGATDRTAGHGSWAGQESTTVYWGWGWIENHSVRDYAKVLRLGFAGIRREIVTQFAAADIADPEFPQKENFWRAALSVCEAGILLGLRYAEFAAQQAAAATDPAECARLEAMADACRRVPAEGARTFVEAVQSLWLAHILTCGEDGINANSIGRLDQILFPYYAADRAAGQLGPDAARELMEELACKLYLDYEVQAITLGGHTRDGRDGVNDLSHIILDATRNLEFARDLSVRLHRHSPPEFVRHAAELIVRGGGIPFIFNDDCFIAALNERGIALPDARDYAPIGCIELTVPGRANPHAVSGWFNSTKCVELALCNGRDPRSGQTVGPATGELADFADFEAFYAAYRHQVEAMGRLMVYHCNRGELAQRERGPLPCWSTLTDDCIRRGRDITDGGAVYNYHSVCLLGTANTADSLMALKQLVFEEKRIAPAELLAALRANFEGHEALRQMLLTQAPKYGNDQAAVDAIAQRVDNDFITFMDRMRSPLGGRYFVHLFSFLCNIAFGKTVGATPDGRRAGEPLAYSLSAHQGRDQAGVTAMLNSLARLPHRRAAGASAAIVEVDPKLVEGEGGVELMTRLLQSAVALGVGQIQWNVVTAERLRQAQADPERYGNLAVRVAGYSQMFKLIPPDLQEHIIARTKHQRG